MGSINEKIVDELVTVSKKDGTYSRIATVECEDTNSYTDKNRVAGKTYYYRVRASMACNDGRRYTAYSAIKSATAKE